MVDRLIDRSIDGGIGLTFPYRTESGKARISHCSHSVMDIHIRKSTNVCSLGLMLSVSRSCLT